MYLSQYLIFNTQKNFVIYILILQKQMTYGQYKYIFPGHVFISKACSQPKFTPQKKSLLNTNGLMACK
jgi:hypothetical protein